MQDQGDAALTKKNPPDSLLGGTPLAFEARVEDKTGVGHALSHTVVTNHMSGQRGMCDFQNLNSTANKPQLFLGRNA